MTGHAGKPRSGSPSRTVGAVLSAFAGGGLFGAMLQASLGSGWTLMWLSIGVAGLTLLGVGLAMGQAWTPLATRKAPAQTRTAPKPKARTRIPKTKVRKTGANGAPAKATGKRTPDVREQLTQVNHQIQRATVKLGLGQLSSDGYNAVVEELKKRRAVLERKLAVQEMNSGTKG